MLFRSKGTVDDAVTVGIAHLPAFMRKGDTTIGFGIMGGWNQSQAHAQFIANVVDFNMNVQLALESARFTKGTFDGCDVQIESRVRRCGPRGTCAPGPHYHPDGGLLRSDGEWGGGDARMLSEESTSRAPPPAPTARRFPSSPFCAT